MVLLLLYGSKQACAFSFLPQSDVAKVLAVDSVEHQVGKAVKLIAEEPLLTDVGCLIFNQAICSQDHSNSWLRSR